MCLNLELFFRVSSLAYPNLLGKKGYVVIVVVYQSYVEVRSEKSFSIPNHTKLRTGKRVYPRPATNLVSISMLPHSLELTGF